MITVMIIQAHVIPMIMKVISSMQCFNMKMEILLLKNFCQTMLFKVCLMMMTMEPMEDHQAIGVKENMISILLPQKWTVL